MLEPWIDAGNVGSMTISWLEDETGARPFAELTRPGNYYDFTRYRPLTYFQGKQRKMRLPNTRISYARQLGGHDFIFLRILEPHTLGDYFVDSVVAFLRTFNVRRYCNIGSMYNYVPHTRPPMVAGGGHPEKFRKQLEELGVHAGKYEGPTTICSLISPQVEAWGGETATMIVSLPQYTQFDDDYIGTLRLQGILSSLYGFVLPEESIHQAEQQRDQINEAVDTNPQVQEIVDELEQSYDNRAGRASSEDDQWGETPELSPQVEDFLREMERRFRRE